MRLAGREYTVIGPRPMTAARFATNYFHETWHVMCQPLAARLLARLLWGLSYQRKPGTIVLIDHPFLDHTPFEAEPSDPFVLVPSELTPLTETAARQLRRKRALTAAPDGTVRWHSHGLDLLDEEGEKRFWDAYVRRHRVHWPKPQPGLVTRRGGLIVFAAAPDTLRAWALRAGGLARSLHQGTNECEIRWPDGEFQVFAEYRRMVTSAAAARREVLAKAQDFDSVHDMRRALWSRSADIRRRRAQQTLPRGGLVHAGEAPAIPIDRPAVTDPG